LLGFFYWLVGRVGRRIQRDKDELRRLAEHDGLTGLYNHRTFYALLGDELARAQRFQRPVSLLMLDIDHFKRVNDTHGHQAGDAILKGLSELLARQARAIDRVCRYGGEEIAIILPESDLEAAGNIAERLRASVETQPFGINTGAPVCITVSIGVASWPLQGNGADTLVAAADTALYEAKRSGRNRICRYEPAPHE
jgi:diguanylate cyclase (GGDEF)-like protein